MALLCGFAGALGSLIGGLQKRRSRAVRQMSAYPLTAAELKTSLNRRFGPISRLKATAVELRRPEPLEIC
jgi:hypothetical protein